MRAIRLVAMAGGLLLGGCALIPHYHRPPPGTAKHWPDGPAYREQANPPGNAPTGDANPGAAAADIGWRNFFTDPRLQGLIYLALENNRNLRVAALNIEQARAQYRIQRGNLLPTINATAQATVEKSPSAVSTSASGGQAGSVVSPGGKVFHYYQVGVGFTNYELDLFGRLRSLDEQALQQVFSKQATRRSMEISLVAEVASDYLTLLSDQALLQISEDTLKSQQHSYKLTKRSYDLGIVTGLDLSQAETSVDTASANIEQYRRLVAQDRNALVLVLGRPLPPNLPPGGDLVHQKFLENLSPGLPSDLLTRRPDVLAAEHTLLAANANIGAARAAFFPSISLTGNFGTASTQLNGLFQNGSKTWTFSPQINLPIFAAGANIANLKLADVEKKIAIAQYQNTVQTAFREVADALAARGTLDRKLAAEKRLARAAHTSYSLSKMRFRQGVDNYLSVLTSQRTLYNAQQSVIATQLARLQNQVTLYKALGGGWKTNTGETAAQARQQAEQRQHSTAE